MSFYCQVWIILSMFWLQVPYQIFANTLSHSVGCHFPFLMLSFAAQKVFNLMKSSYLFSSLVLVGKFCTIFNGIIILGWVNISPWIFYDFFHQNTLNLIVFTKYCFVKLLINVCQVLKYPDVSKNKTLRTASLKVPYHNVIFPINCFH